MLVAIMTGWGGLGGYLEDLNDRRQRAADPNDNSPGANLTRRACDWAARKGGVVAASPQVRYGCGPYWEEQDDYAPPDEVQPGTPPFEGGQCAELYDVFISRDDDCTGAVESRTASNVQGPLGGGQWSKGNEAPGSDSSCELFIWSSSMTTATGQLNRNRVSTTAPSWRVERADGQPDDCGDPPAGPDILPPPREVPPTLLPPDGTPVPIGDPNDPNDTTPPVVFPPTDTPFDPFIPIINPPPGFPPFVLPPPSDPAPITGEPTDVTGAGEEEDEEDDGITELIGYEFEVLDSAGFQTRIPNTNPVIYTRVVGSLQLRLEDTSGRVFYSDNLQITSARGSIVRNDRSLKVTGVSYNSIPQLDGLRLRQIRGVALS